MGTKGKGENGIYTTIPNIFVSVPKTMRTPKISRTPSNGVFFIVPRKTGTILSEEKSGRNQKSSAIYGVSRILPTFWTKITDRNTINNIKMFSCCPTDTGTASVADHDTSV